MGLSFWIAHALQSVGKPIAPSEFQWLLFVIMPFGPTILEVVGFYRRESQKPVSKSLIQLAHGALWTGMLIAAWSFVFRLNLPDAAVMAVFGGMAFVSLIVRERITIWWRRRYSDREEV